MKRNRLLPLIACLLFSALSLTARSHPTEAIQAPASSVTGTVTTVSGSMITLMNGIVAIDATGAPIMGRNGPATLATIVPGTRIFAALRQMVPAGPVPVASVIHIIDPPGGLLNSTIDSVNVTAGTFSIFGKTVKVTPATRFHATRDLPRNGLADLRAGDLAAVEVDVRDGALVALSVAVLPSPPVVLSGTVRVIGATSWVIGVESRDVTVNVNAATRIVGPPVVGDSVAVVATSDAAGVLTATSIEKRTPRPENPPVTLSGTVRVIGTSSWVILVEGRVGSPDRDVTVNVTAATRIIGAPAVGDTVGIIATSDAAGVLTATSIEKKTRPENTELTLGGTVRVIGNNSWVIAVEGQDVTVNINSATRIVGAPVVGDLVAVVATRDSAGGLTAVSIEKRTRTEIPPAPLSGTVRVIGPASWVIAIEGRDVTINVSATTRIVGAPVVGDTVAVMATRDAAGVLTAVSIEKRTPRPENPPVTVSGTVRVIGNTSWVIAVEGPITSPSRDVTVNVNATTRIVGAPAVGDLVAVVATVDSAGVLTAVSIEKRTRPENPPVTLGGTVRVIGNASWVIAADGRDVTVNVTATTRIVGAPVVGDSVSVVATRDANGALTAVSIEKRTPPTTPPTTPPVTLGGTVRVIGTTSWVIATEGRDVTVNVTATTRIVGAPVVGDTVSVVATRDAAGALTAVSIEKRTPPTTPPTIPPVTLGGTVRVIGTTSWVIAAEGRDVTVNVTATTRIVGAPVVGDTVSVVATRDATGVLTAVSIEKRTPLPSPPPVTLSGTVRVIGTASWVIAVDGQDLTVNLTSATRIVGSPAVGDLVAVVVTRDAAGRIMAISIEKKTRPETPPPTTSITFEGTVRTISTLEWNIEGRRIFIDRNTRIIGSPAVNDRVKVVGQMRTDGIIAVSIEKR